jgi:hypothetical protein
MNTQVKNMIPSRVAAKRALMLVTRLRVAAINTTPTAYAQKRRPGIHEGTIVATKRA